MNNLKDMSQKEKSVCREEEGDGRKLSSCQAQFYREELPTWMWGSRQGRTGLDGSWLLKGREGGPSTRMGILSAHIMAPMLVLRAGVCVL